MLQCIQQQIGFITKSLDPLTLVNSPQQRVLNSNRIPPTIPSRLISNERIEHRTTDLGPLHRSDKPGLLTKNIPSIPKPTQSKCSKIPTPAASSTIPNNVDRKNIHNSPQSANRSSAKRSRTKPVQ